MEQAKDEFHAALGAAIREMRDRSGMTRDSVVKCIGPEASLTRRKLYRLELGIDAGTNLQYVRIAQALGLELAHLTREAEGRVAFLRSVRERAGEVSTETAIELVRISADALDVLDSVIRSSSLRAESG